MLDLTRRRLLTGLLAAPIIIRTPGLLMPVKRALLARHTITIEAFGLTTMGQAHRMGRWHLDTALNAEGLA